MCGVKKIRQIEVKSARHSQNVNKLSRIFRYRQINGKCAEPKKTKNRQIEAQLECKQSFTTYLVFSVFFHNLQNSSQKRRKIKLLIYVKYLMTIYIMTQVTIIPPKSKYLSPSDRRSISLITVFDMPKVEATSSIFLRMPFSIDR